MPNWCGNRLSISGDKDTLLVFALAAKGSGEQGDLCLNNLHPCHKDLHEVSSGTDDIAFDVMFGDLDKIYELALIPENIKKDREALLDFLSAHYKRDMRVIGQKMKDNVDKYGAKHWYDWCNKNWGTKWDIEARLDQSFDDELVYYFDSAWSPPVEAFQKISEDFPGLTFSLEYFESGMGFGGKIVLQDGGATYEVR